MNNAVSFFAGAGGLDMGLKNAGFDIKLAVELEGLYCQTLKTNFPNLNVKQGDIMNYSKEKLLLDSGLKSSEEIDLIFGGSPCQSFSTAGNRLAFGSAGGKAMLKFAELISEVKPKAFLLENVKGLLSAPLRNRPLAERGEGFPDLEEDEKRGTALKHILSKFTDYNVVYKLVNAADYGVPQKRERVFFVGFRKDLEKTFEFPEPTHFKNPEGEQEKWISFREVMDSLENVEHTHVNYSNDRLRFMRLIPEGGGYWKHLPQELIEEAMGGAFKSTGGKVGFYRRIYAHDPSPTVLTSPTQKSTVLGHPYEHRPLSIQEYLAIQTFPDGYVVKGTLAKQYVQIGNAVPVKLAEVIGKAILSKINKKTLVK